MPVAPKKLLQPQLIRYDTSVNADAPNQSLALSVNRSLTLFQRSMCWSPRYRRLIIDMSITDPFRIHDFQKCG